MKTITDQLAEELALDSTTLCRLWRITLKLPASDTPVKVIRITDHDQDITFPEEDGTTTATGVVSSKDIPWDPTIGTNPSWSYNTPGTSPVSIDVTGRHSIVVSRTGGLTTFTFGLRAQDIDANGDLPTEISQGASNFPNSHATTTALGVMALMGTFADAGGNVIKIGGVFQIYEIGNGPTTLTVPHGATQLLLGLNDTAFADNAGEFDISYTITGQNQVYEAAGGFTASAVEHKSDTSADNLEVMHFLDAEIISEDDLRAGLYDFAEVELHVVSWAHPDYGSLKLLKGTLGQVSLKNGLATTELRGLTQKGTTVVGSTYGPVCRADLFDGKWATADPVGDPSNHWRCRKDPTAYTFDNSVGSSPDAITIIPATTLPTLALPGSNNNKVTLNGIAVQAAFAAQTHDRHGSFDLAFSGDTGTPGGGGAGAPYIFGSGTHATIAATATGNSLVFNGAGLYTIQPLISPIDWNLLNSVGNYVGATAPWSGAKENYNMMVYGQLYIPVAGHVTFNVLHDDGCFFAMVPTADHPTDYVSIVSGPQCGPGTSNLNLATGPFNQKATAFNGYYFGDSWANRYVASDNRQGNRNQSWTLNFPAAGTYAFEFCFSNYEHRQQLWVTVAGQGNILPDNLSAAAGITSGPWDDGAIKFTTGNLKDRVFDIQTVEEVGSPPVAQIKLFAGAPLPFPPELGDTFKIQAGCNRLTSDCKFKFDNMVNFQGENQMPGNLVILQTPDTH